MSYTWEEVMLGIDVRSEMKEKQSEEEAILEKQEKEQKAMAGWSLGLSLLGAVSGLGPVGYFLGKQIGTYGADVGLFDFWKEDRYSDWEKDVEDITIGKFHTDEAKKFKKEKKKEVKATDQAQWINTGLDLLSLYTMSGGLEKGEWDPTTFGGGENQWKVFGKKGTPGTPGIPAGDPIYWSDRPGAKPYISPAVEATPGIPGIKSLKDIIGEGGGMGAVKSAYGAATNPTGTLAGLYTRQQEGK